MGKFSLYHTALYSKGWYKRENNQSIWEDLKVILSLDGYSGEIMTKFDVVNVILTQSQKLGTTAFTDLIQFANGISQSQCWKSGYYTKDCNWVKDSKELPEYDYYEAIVKYCLSEISITDVETLGKLPKPDYKKGLPRKNGISNKRLKEVFT